MQTKRKYEWGEGVYTLLSWFKKERVKNARVLVAGAGALGNEVVKDLALFGIGHIYVVDFDRIEISNLTRSVLFREDDAYNHRFKAEVVAQRAREINPQIEVIPIVGNLASEVGLGLYRSVDVVIGCLDSRIARYLLNRMSIRAGKSWIDGGIENLSGIAKVYTPGFSCYECEMSREAFNYLMLRTGCADVVRTQSKAGRVATTPITASIIGAIQVQEAMKIIHADESEKQYFKTLQGRLLNYEGMTNSYTIFKQAQWKKSCPAHQTWDNVIESNLSATMKISDLLRMLRKLLNVKSVEIYMVNNKFIDKIYSDNPEKVFTVKTPESKIDDFINANPELRKLSVTTILHKSYVEVLDMDFSYPELTAQQVGIPLFDVLQVGTEKGRFNVELSADAHHFNIERTILK